MFFSALLAPLQSTAAAYVPAMSDDTVFAASLIALFVLPLLLLPLLKEKKNTPPRFGVMVPLVKGELNLKDEGALAVVWKAYKKHGDVFRVRLFTEMVTIMIGSDANAAFFEQKDSVLSQREVYGFTVPVFGKGVVYDAPLSVMTQQLRFVKHGLSALSMATHAGKIVRETEEYFAKWGDAGEVDLYHVLSELTIMTASRCLLGREIRENVQHRFADLYQDLSDGMSHLSFFATNLPTTAHRKRNAARAEIAAMFTKVIQERRASGVKDDDYLQVLIDSSYKDGSKPTDDEIVGLLLAALFAGQHTSNITSTWMGLLIMANKQELLPDILKEQEKVLSASPGGKLTLDALMEMDLLHNCMKETLRMYPPLILLMRKVKTDITYRGYTIPAGDIAMVCPPVSHRLPEAFKDPDEFQPRRFMAPRYEDDFQREGSTVGKYSYIAFGRGRHACLGERFAFLQIKTIWSVLFRLFDFEPVDAALPKPDYSAIVVGPKAPCMVRFKRKPSPYAMGKV